MSDGAAITISEIPLSVELMRRHDLSREECILYGVVVAYARINVRPTFRQLLETWSPAYRRKPLANSPERRRARARIAKLLSLRLVERAKPERRGVGASHYWPVGPR